MFVTINVYFNPEAKQFINKYYFMTGEDVNNPHCQRFYNDALTVSFTKILTDDAVSSWKNNIQQCVRSNCEKLVKLCAMKLDDPRFLHLLYMIFNPGNKYEICIILFLLHIWVLFYALLNN